MVTLSMCIIFDFAVVFFLGQLSYTLMRIRYAKIVHKTKIFIKGYRFISPLIKIRPRRRGVYHGITTLTFAIKKGHNVLEDQK